MTSATRTASPLTPRAWVRARKTTSRAPTTRSTVARRRQSDECPEPFGDAAEEEEERETCRPEVGPRLADDPWRRVPGRLLAGEEARVDPVPEVRDVRAVEDRSEPAHPGESAEVGLLGRDRRLQGFERPRLDQHDPIDGALDSEGELAAGRLIVGPQDLDPTESEDHDERESRQWSRPDAPSREPDPDQDDRQQFRDQVPAGEHDVEGDQEADSDPRRASTTGRGDARPPARPEDEDQCECGHRDAQDLDRQAGQLRPGAGDVPGKERETGPDEGRCDQGEPERGETADDPRPERDRSVGSGPPVDRTVRAGRARRRRCRRRPAARQSIAAGDGQAEGEDRARHVEPPARTGHR